MRQIEQTDVANGLAFLFKGTAKGDTAETADDGMRAALFAGLMAEGAPPMPVLSHQAAAMAMPAELPQAAHLPDDRIDDALDFGTGPVASDQIGPDVLQAAAVVFGPASGMAGGAVPSGPQDVTVDAVHMLAQPAADAPVAPPPTLPQTPLPTVLQRIAFQRGDSVARVPDAPRLHSHTGAHKGEAKTSTGKAGDDPAQTALRLPQTAVGGEPIAPQLFAPLPAAGAAGPDVEGAPAPDPIAQAGALPRMEIPVASPAVGVQAPRPAAPALDGPRDPEQIWMAGNAPENAPVLLSEPRPEPMANPPLPAEKPAPLAASGAQPDLRLAEPLPAPDDAPTTPVASPAANSATAPPLRAVQPNPPPNLAQVVNLSGVLPRAPIAAKPVTDSAPQIVAEGVVAPATVAESAPLRPKDAGAQRPLPFLRVTGMELPEPAPRHGTEVSAPPRLATPAPLPPSDGMAAFALPNDQNLTVDLSPQPAPAAGGSLALDQPDWEARLVERLTMEITAEGGRIDLTLTPENLGRLEVTVELRDGRAEVSFVTETRAAADLIAQSETRLSELLSKSGLDLAGQDSTPRQNGRDGQGQERGPIARPRHDAADPNLPNPPRPVLADGRLNLIA